MTTHLADLDDLRRDRPEWTPWLTVVGAALDEIGGSGGDVGLHADIARKPDVPLLANARLDLEE